MSDLISLDQSALSYLVECNLGISAFTVLKMFHMDSKLCTRITKVVTALKLKFPELAKVLE